MRKRSGWIFSLFVLVSVAFIAWPAPQVDGIVTVTLHVQGPDGIIWNDTVVASPPTAFDALLAASDKGSFGVEWSGSQGARYVISIADVGGRDGGWCVQRNAHDGLGFRDSPVSSDRFLLEDGDTVRWYWTNTACEKF